MISTDTSLPALCRTESFTKVWVQAFSEGGTIAFCTDNYGVPTGHLQELAPSELTHLPDEEQTEIEKERRLNEYNSYGDLGPRLPL